jgi:hypothetical protein
MAFSERRGFVPAVETAGTSPAAREQTFTEMS